MLWRVVFFLGFCLNLGLFMNDPQLLTALAALACGIGWYDK